MKLLVATALTVCAGNIFFLTGRAVGATSDISHYAEKIATPKIEMEEPDLTWEDPEPPSNPVSVLPQIVNTGYYVWTIVENNRPAIAVNRTYANAIPGDAKSMDLLGFSDLQFETFRLYGKNQIGATVYDVSYTLAHRYNGSIDGHGKYLENVTVLPHEIKMLWGYRLNMSVVKASAVNLGSKKNAIGSVLLELGIRISTVLKSHEITKLYEFRGDSPKVKELRTTPVK